MTQQLTNAQIKQFFGEVEHQYKQEKSYVESTLVGAGMTVRTITGTHVSFPTMDGVELVDRGPSLSELTPQNPNIYRKEFGLSNHAAFFYTDIFDQAVVDFNEQKELSKAIAGAVYRRRDKVLLDALNLLPATSTLNLLNFDTCYALPDEGVFSVDKIKTMMTHFTKIGVPAGNRVIVIDADSFRQLLDDVEFISSDYNNAQVLNSPEPVFNFLGFKIVVVPDSWDQSGNKVGGLDLSADGGVYKRTCYALDGRAVAGATNPLEGKNIVIDYESKRTAHSICATLRAGFGARNARGIIRFKNNVTSLI